MDLPHNIFLYLLIVTAIAVGFVLGRRERRPRKSQSATIKDYYQGLNFLLGDRPELGVDRFIQAMEVSEESIDVHLALASVVRRRGEVDKAIRIHQNLLASPALRAGNKQLVEFELARDFHAAGLLDRAEALLSDIVKRRDAQEKQARDLLLDIYEQERDWQRAIEVGSKSLRIDASQKMRLSHFYCERGNGFLRAGQLKLAAENARAAIRVLGTNPRAHLLSAEIDLVQKRYKRVLRYVRRAVELQPDLAGEVLDIFAKAAQGLGQEGTYLEFLEECLQRSPDAALIEASVDYRRGRGLKTNVVNIVDAIKGSPRAEHLPVLLDLLELRAGDQVEMDGSVKELLEQIVVQSRTHQCINCGFSSHAHVWHCPTCKQWGTFANPNRVKSRAVD